MDYKFKDVADRQLNNGKNCVARAICLATGISFIEVHFTLEMLGQLEGTVGAAPRNGRRRRSHPTRGMFRATYQQWLERLGWEYVTVPQGMMLDLMPHQGTIIIQFRRHLATAVEGIIYDTWDCRKREILGYFRKIK